MARSESVPISLTRRDATGARGDSRFAVVWLDGEHDLSTKVALSAVVDRASELDNADVLVDLSGVTFMDASTVGALIAARNRLAARSLSLTVRAASPAAARVLALCGLSALEQRPELLLLHPTGAGSALGTWVEVPHRDAAEARRDTPERAMAGVDRDVS